MLDLDRGAAWDGVEELLGAPGRLPPRVDAGRPVGRLDAAGLPGALASAVLTVAGHDHPVAAIGAGAIGADDLFDSCGTAQALVRSTATPPPPATRVRLAAQGLNTGRHPLPGQFMILGGTRGGLLLRRVLALLGVDSLERQLELDARTLALPAGAGDIEISGAMGVDSPGIAVHLAGDDLGPEQLWAAALDHAVRISGHKVRAIDEAVGPHGRVVAAGGWTRVEGYRRRKRASVPGVEFSTEDEPGGRGAAMLAAVAAAGLDPAAGVRRVFR
jgi:sugar (pentulose or hexulose) kinase